MHTNSDGSIHASVILTKDVAARILRIRQKLTERSIGVAPTMSKLLLLLLIEALPLVEAKLEAT